MCRLLVLNYTFQRAIHTWTPPSLFFIDGMYNHTHLVKHLLIHYYSPFNEYNNFTTAAVSAST